MLASGPARGPARWIAAYKRFSGGGPGRVVPIDAELVTGQGGGMFPGDSSPSAGSYSADPVALFRYEEATQAAVLHLRRVDAGVAAARHRAEQALAPVALVDVVAPVGRPFTGDRLAAHMATTGRFAGDIARSLAKGSDASRLPLPAGERVNGFDDLIMNSIPTMADGIESAVHWLSGNRYRAVADRWNRSVVPAAVTALSTVGDVLIPNRDAWQPNGESRGRLAMPPTDGRSAIVRALSATMDDEMIRPDEILLIEHRSGVYTVVLPGVIDLTDPSPGLDRRHRSSRDLDVGAARSAASSATADNLYAQTVAAALADEIPPGARLALVGYSYGADTALDLAADPAFARGRYEVTHVVAAGYHSEPQLSSVQPSIDVLVLQNNKDIIIAVEDLFHLDPKSGEINGNHSNSGNAPTVSRFDGGWRGLGHHPANYLSYLGQTEDRKVVEFAERWSSHGHTTSGLARSVDVSVAS